MNGKKFIPAPDAEFDEWLQKFANALKLLANTIGIANADVQAVETLTNAWIAAFQNHLATRDTARAATETKDEARADAELFVRRLAREIQAKANTTDAHREQLGITVKDVEPTPTSPDYVQTLAPPLVVVDFSQPQRAVIHFGKNPQNERENAKPKYIAGARITFRLISPNANEVKAKNQSKFVDDMPEYTAFNEWLFVADDTNSPYLHIVETNTPLTLEYRAQWFDKKMRLGPPGEAARVTISP